MLAARSTPVIPTSPPARRALAALATVAVVGATVTAVDGPATTHAAGVDANDWLSIVNIYRAQSGLQPVAANGSWDAGTTNHSCWMLLNGIAHDEAPGTPGYTAEGDQAGNSANVAVSSVERHHGEGAASTCGCRARSTRSASCGRT